MITYIMVLDSVQYCGPRFFVTLWGRVITSNRSQTKTGNFSGLYIRLRFRIWDSGLGEGEV